MSDIVAIDRIRRVWNKLEGQYQYAIHKFELAKELAREDYAGCEFVTADEFFKYLKSIKQERATNRTPRVAHGVDIDGDFDDMGNERIAAQYHYNQKRKNGRL